MADAAAASPLVSVVLPTYNRERLVGRAVTSVLSQALPDLELLLVDDGSTDATEQAVRAAHGHDRRLVYLRKANGGTASARNHGLERARGRYVAFLDSDDAWLPGNLASQVAALARAPQTGLSICDAGYEGSWGRLGETIFADPYFRPPTSLESMLGGAWAIPSTWCFHREAVSALRFRARYRHSEDTEFLFQFFAQGGSTVFNPDVVTIYTKHDGTQGEPQKMDQQFGFTLDRLAMLEAYSASAADPATHRDAIFRTRRELARELVAKGRWRDARPLLWEWWKKRPDSTTALRWWLRSLLARRQPR